MVNELTALLISLRRQVRLTLAFTVLCVPAACGQSPRAVMPKRTEAVRVETASGPLVGREQKGVRDFLGIPFAAPPVGPLRWRAPQAVALWSLARDATRRGRACAQLKGGGVVAGSGDDCQILNMWTPVGAGQRLPVLFWIPGAPPSAGLATR